MAERRMFAKTIIDSDAFLEMPQSTQLLYFHLSMRADDDGFINKPRAVMRVVGCKEDDLKILAAKKFIIPFESGIVVIKHWKIHNYIAKDRYTETKYKDEKATLALDENGSYTNRIQIVDDSETQVRLGKDSIGKDSIEEESTTQTSAQASPSPLFDNDSTDESSNKPTNESKDIVSRRRSEKKTFQKPTVDEVKAYCIERDNNIDPEYFVNYNESRGWVVGKLPMRDWKAAIRTWEKHERDYAKANGKGLKNGALSDKYKFAVNGEI